MRQVFPPSRRAVPRRAMVALVLALVLVGLAPESFSAAVAPEPVGTWPLAGAGTAGTGPRVVRDFDPPTDPFGSGHRGVDLAGTLGEAVHSALGGTVTYAGPLAGRGVVVVDHGDTRTTYEPVVAVVKVGDHVAQGAVIGHLELVGSHCFPAACLHWGWRRGEVYLDPLGLVESRPIRLLPFQSQTWTAYASRAGSLARPIPVIETWAQPP